MHRIYESLGASTLDALNLQRMRVNGKCLELELGNGESGIELLACS